MRPIKGVVSMTLFVIFAMVSTVGAQAPQPAPKPAAPVPAPARMSNALVDALLALAKERYSNTLLGMSKSVDDSLALSVRSNRNLIAWRNASAVEDGGRFIPPADMRLDVVIVKCGDSDLGDIFECARVSVVRLDGRRITPASYNAGPQSYRNALGARWTVREVFATYHARDMRDGFTVTFVGTDGTEWDLKVSAEEAESELLLKLDPAAASTVSPAAAQGPPPSLELTIERDGNGWRIANKSPGYTWKDCKAAVGDSTAMLPSLAPNNTVIVKRSDFQPTLDPGSPSENMWVSCPAKGTTLTVVANSGSPAFPSEVEPATPPSEFQVKVERDGNGWRIQNASPDSLTDCRVTIGASWVNISDLGTRGAVIINRENFLPALGDTAGATMKFQCKAKGKTVVASAGL